MLLMIDNYDSFTYNLVQYFGELGETVRVYRNDALRPEDLKRLQPSKIVVSPGPGRPADAGISKEIIRTAAGRYPVLGVCLGHQCIGEVFGGTVVRSRRIMHGKTSLIFHNDTGLFRGLANPFEATRYHSLIVKRENLPDELEIIAWTEHGEIMGLQHQHFLVCGIQFHPESILTRQGKDLLRNFLWMAEKFWATRAHT
ncbi:MAG: aminodeoxychorismate/anthranilate synthase component II [Desulfobacterota bacterium]|nr:aminodeoxychorismate/anthranilate synthase component II [Thermodesulfobacteriota bacterium]